MKTLLLDVPNWDLTKNVAGNIALAPSDAYALAQDAASAIKLFQGELYYDTTKGVPYWAEILGKSPPLSLMKAKFEDAARTVPGVKSARCFIESITGRVVRGQVKVTAANGQTATASF